MTDSWPDPITIGLAGLVLLAVVVVVVKAFKGQLRQGRGSPIRRSRKRTLKSMKVKVSREIVTVGPDGQKQRYHSLDEVPEELRQRIEELRASSTGADQAGEQAAIHTGITMDINGKKYHFDSLEEVPEELRQYLPPHFR